MSIELKRSLIEALRVTSARLRLGAAHQWGHFGACNCGHLAQTLTGRRAADIHRAAIERAASFRTPVDDWTEAAVEYCPLSGLPLDDVIEEMLAAGVTTRQLQHLETLTDPAVVRRIPFEQRHLRRNRREDVVLYLETWADLLEEQVIEAQGLADLPLAAE